MYVTNIQSLNLVQIKSLISITITVLTHLFVMKNLNKIWLSLINLSYFDQRYSNCW